METRSLYSQNDPRISRNEQANKASAQVPKIHPYFSTFALRLSSCSSDKLSLPER